MQATMGIKLKVLDPTENCSAASVAEHVLGDFSDFDTVRWGSHGCYMCPVGSICAALRDAMADLPYLSHGCRRWHLLRALELMLVGPVSQQQQTIDYIGLPTPALSCCTLRNECRYGDSCCNRDFVKGEDVLTVEIEHVDAQAMQAVQDASGVDVEPTPHTLALIQDKFLQKEHFNKKCGVKVTSYIEISGEGSADLAGMVLGFPFMLKAKRYARG